MAHPFRFGAVSGLLLAACSSAGSASVNGTVLGTSLSPSSTIVVGDEIFISSNGDACSDLQKATNRKGVQNLTIASSNGIQVGTWPLDHATFQSFDDVCNTPISTTTAQGTVTFTSVDTSGALNIDGAVHGATGTYDITFGADHITGSFTAADCSISAMPTSFTGCR